MGRNFKKWGKFGKKRWVLAIILIISRGTSAKFFPLRWITKLPFLILFWILKDDLYSCITFALNKKKLETKNPRFSSLPLRLFFIQILLGKKSASLENYSSLLTKHQFQSEIKFDFVHRFMSTGRLDLAKATVLDLINRKPDDFFSANGLKIYRQAGIICFLLGQNKEANYYWKLAGQFRKILFKPNTPTKYRILGSNWFVAVGHVALLDYYLKYNQLYRSKNHRIVIVGQKLSTNLGCASELLKKFSELGIVMLETNELNHDYDKWAKKNDAPSWSQLSDLEKEAMIDDFWDFEFPDGEILSYTHATARIQKDWEQKNYPPLFSVTQAEKKWLENFLTNLGMPSSSWFVCLHVREAGFHKQWNSKLPAMRDSEITDYYLAIEEIVKAGGWVVRMGDPSMKEIPFMRNVIDYAHSPYRLPFADVILAASCRFFLGTNSGFATIPAIYGTPCALSNWVPIGWPLWPMQDLMICKLFREKTSQRLLRLEEIFERGLAFLQNWSDLPEDIELVSNSPEDIRQLTLEMLSCSDSKKVLLSDTGPSLEVQKFYNNIASKYETFTGSRFAGSFVKNYPEIFTFSEMKKNIHHHEIIISKLQENVSQFEALR